MTHRFAIVSTLGLVLGNISCSVITDFEGWRAHPGGTAGDAGIGNAGRDAGIAGNALGAAAGVAGTATLGETTNVVGNGGFWVGAAGMGVGGVATAGQSAGGVAGQSATAGAGAGANGAASEVAGTAGKSTMNLGGNPASGGVAGSAMTAGTSAGTAGTTQATGGGNAGTSSTNDCPGTGGPTMVKLPQGYCIDSTEVTRAQYAAWLNTTTAATINAQDVASCGWNTTFVPPENCMSDTRACQGSCDNHPQVCVDWCDAYAYCRGVGKRLCGKIRGGQVNWGDVAGAATNQWYNACSSGGVNTYPYGDIYDGNACNGDGYQSPNHIVTTVAVGRMLDCQAPVPYAGVFDMSGNVWEWEDSCSDTTLGIGAYCRLRGGGYANANPERDLACDAGSATLSRTTHHSSFGIRCCSP